MALKGRNALIQILHEGQYVTIAGMVSKNFSVNRETIDLTTDTTGLVWKRLMADPNATIEISGAAIFKDDLAMNAIENLSHSGESYSFRIIYGSYRYVIGSYVVSDFEYLGQTTDAQRASFTLQSADISAHDNCSHICGWIFSGVAPADLSLGNLALYGGKNLDYDISTNTWIIAESGFTSFERTVWISNDNGDSWEEVSVGFAFNTSGNAVLSNNNGVWIVTSNQYFYRSTDKGLTWNLIYTTPSGNGISSGGSAVYYDEEKSRFLLAGINYLWYSDDAGLTWTEIGVSGQNSHGGLTRFKNKYILVGSIRYTEVDVDTFLHTSTTLPGPVFSVGKGVTTNQAGTELLLFEDTSGDVHRFYRTTNLIDWELVYEETYDGVFHPTLFSDAIYVKGIGYMAFSHNAWIADTVGRIKIRHSLTGDDGTWRIFYLETQDSADSFSIDIGVFATANSPADTVAIGTHQKVYFLNIDPGGYN